MAATLRPQKFKTSSPRPACEKFSSKDGQMDTEATWIHGQEVKGWPGIHSKKNRTFRFYTSFLGSIPETVLNGIYSSLNNIKSVLYITTITIFRSLDGFVVLF